jgi:DNA invertase Pin-like site-specific DNA recombinase
MAVARQDYLRMQKRPEKEREMDSWNTALPLMVQWGIYARQSTMAQLKKHANSTEMQTEDLQAWLESEGVNADRIALYDADLGLSGQLRIDQRPDLSRLMNDIERGFIKAVLVYQVSRLFRDLTAIQYDTFADVCAKAGCILATANGMIFNFKNRFHVKMFRYLSEMAAEYIPQQIGLLHEARERKARKGVYVGLGPVATGYIVDYDKYSETYLKYVPYEAWSSVVFRLFKRFYELDGNITLLCRELDTILVLFPDVPEELQREFDERNFPRKNRKRVPGGYHISHPGLVSILTNPVYIGWWIVMGDVVSRDNHTPIIPPEYQYLFWFAFDRLSPLTIEGEVNTKRAHAPRRFYQRHTNVTSGILKLRITSEHGNVFANTSARTGTRYIIYPDIPQVKRTPLCEIDAECIDSPFTQVFLAHLLETHDLDHYRQWIDSVIQRRVEEENGYKRQLQTIANHQESILNDIEGIRVKINEQATSPEHKKVLEAEYAPLIDKWHKRYLSNEALKRELQGKLLKPEVSEEFENIRRYADFQTEVRRLIPVWDNKPFGVRLEFVNLFVKEARLTIVATHWVQLDILWTHPSWQGDRIFIYRWRGSNDAWTDEEEAVIATYYQTAAKEELLQRLQHKSWGSIAMHASQYMGLRHRMQTPGILPKNVTWSDYQFLQAQGIDAGSRSLIFEQLSPQTKRGWKYPPSARLP